MGQVRAKSNSFGWTDKTETVCRQKEIIKKEAQMSKRKNNVSNKKVGSQKSSNNLVLATWLIGVVSSASDAYQLLQQGVQLLVSAV